MKLNKTSVNYEVYIVSIFFIYFKSHIGLENVYKNCL